MSIRHHQSQYNQNLCDGIAVPHTNLVNNSSLRLRCERSTGYVLCPFGLHRTNLIGELEQKQVSSFRMREAI